MLKDRFGRVISYLRISVTPRCNLRCIYCISKNSNQVKNFDFLSNQEIFRISRIAVFLGIKKIRLTGGEPLLKEGIVDLVKDIISIKGLEDLSLTTNGTLLEDYAFTLRKAGLRRINISLDTLDKEKFERITNGRSFEKVMRGIDSAISAGFEPIKINVVVIKGINDDEIERFIDFGIKKNLIIRFIEYMPISEREDFSNRFVSMDEILKRISCFKKGEKGISLSSGEPSKYIEIMDGKRVGIISSVSHSFCESCNRLRLTYDGFLRPCLTHDFEIDLKNPLRNGADDSKIEELFRKAVMLKPEKGCFRGEIKRDMREIGG